MGVGGCQSLWAHRSGWRVGDSLLGLSCGLWPVGWCYFKGTTGWSTLLILGSLRLGMLGLGHRELCLLGPI